MYNCRNTPAALTVCRVWVFEFPNPPPQPLPVPSSIDVATVGYHSLQVFNHATISSYGHSEGVIVLRLFVHFEILPSFAVALTRG